VLADFSTGLAGSSFGTPAGFPWDEPVATALVGPLLPALMSEDGPALTLVFGLLPAA
jgi:hypothetical protein